MKKDEKTEQKIGIDRSILKNITITKANLELLRKRARDVGTINSPAYDIRISSGKPSVIKNHHISEIEIIDKFFGKLTAKIRRNHLTGQNCYYSEFQLSPFNDGNNLANLSADEYRLRIENVSAHFQDIYGLVLDFSKCRISALEINTTIKLRENFKAYEQVLGVFMALLPIKFYQGNKIGMWSDIATGNIETFLVKNSSAELKIYDKTKHLADAHIIPLPNNYMRVEYRFQRISGTALENFNNLTDKMLSEKFLKYFRRDIAEPYEHWKKQNEEELKQLLQVHMQKRDWVSGFSRDCRQQNATQRLPLLFDLSILKKCLNDIFKGDKNRARKVRAIMKKFTYEQDLTGNALRASEIIEGVSSLK